MLKNEKWSPRGDFSTRGEVIPPSFPSGVKNTLYCLEECRGEQRISPPGITSPLGDKFTPRGPLRPWGSKFAPRGEVKKWPRLTTKQNCAFVGNFLLILSLIVNLGARDWPLPPRVKSLGRIAEIAVACFMGNTDLLSHLIYTYRKQSRGNGFGITIPLLLYYHYIIIIFYYYTTRAFASKHVCKTGMLVALGNY
jgi:hypothetical protein